MATTFPYYNYRTSQYDQISDETKDLHDYVPQSTAAQILYDSLLRQGHAPLTVVVHMLSLALGDKGILTSITL